jgi:EmrB/QacA subfamily drug resistance transporter
MPIPANQSGAAVREAGPGEPSYGVSLLVIAAATLLVTLDSTIVNVALPAIRTGLDFGPTGLEWVVTAYSVTFGGLLLLGGRAGDRFGRRRMFMIGIGVFTAASLLGGLAMNQPWLIAARAVQGLGAAIAAPAALSLIAVTFPAGAARNKAMGVYAAVAGFGGSVGLVLGGLLTQFGSWRWVFFVAVPVGALVLVAAPRVLAEAPTRSERLDLPGAVAATGGVALLVYGLIRGTRDGWAVTGTVAPLAAAVLLLVAFTVLEGRVEQPLLPLRLLADRSRSGAYLVTLMIGLGLYGVTFFLMLYVQEVLGFGVIAAGLGFLPLAVAIGLLAATMGRLATRIGTRPGVVIGPLVAAGGAIWLSLAATGDAGYLSIVGPLILFGSGLGAAIVPLTLTVIAEVRPADAGIASALVSTGQQVGGALGLAVLGAVLAATQDGAGAGSAAGYQAAFLTAGGFLAAGSLIAAGLVRPITARAGRR